MFNLLLSGPSSRSSPYPTSHIPIFGSPRPFPLEAGVHISQQGVGSNPSPAFLPLITYRATYPALIVHWIRSILTPSPPPPRPHRQSPDHSMPPPPAYSPVPEEEKLSEDLLAIRSQPSRRVVWA